MIHLLLLFLLFISKIETVPLTYGYISGILDFTENNPIQSVELTHYKTPTILYSLSSVNISSYFSYFSNYTLVENSVKDNLTISVMIGGTYTFKLSITYAYMESMLNIEVAFLNLTYERPLKVYNSKKGLVFN